MYYISGLYWDNGKENENNYGRVNILCMGFYKDNGKNGNYKNYRAYIVLIQGLSNIEM